MCYGQHLVMFQAQDSHIKNKFTHENKEKFFIYKKKVLYWR